MERELPHTARAIKKIIEGDPLTWIGVVLGVLLLVGLRLRSKYSRARVAKVDGLEPRQKNDDAS